MSRFDPAMLQQLFNSGSAQGSEAIQAIFRNRLAEDQLGLERDRMAQQGSQFDTTTALERDRMAQQGSQFDRSYGLDRDRFQQANSQFDQTFDLNQQQFDLARDNAAFGQEMQGRESDRADKALDINAIHAAEPNDTDYQRAKQIITGMLRQGQGDPKDIESLAASVEARQPGLATALRTITKSGGAASEDALSAFTNQGTGDDYASVAKYYLPDATPDEHAGVIASMRLYAKSGRSPMEFLQAERDSRRADEQSIRDEIGAINTQADQSRKRIEDIGKELVSKQNSILPPGPKSKPEEVAAYKSALQDIQDLQAERKAELKRLEALRTQFDSAQARRTRRVPSGTSRPEGAVGGVPTSGPGPNAPVKTLKSKPATSTGGMYSGRFGRQVTADQLKAWGSKYKEQNPNATDAEIRAALRKTFDLRPGSGE